MHVTYLGHAGFAVETGRALILMDPWLSPGGAFDGAWFQYPRNHDLADPVRSRFDGFPGRRFIYLSHEHRDHFDLPFLESLADRGFELLIPRFHNDRMLRELQEYRCAGLRVLGRGETVDLGDGTLTMYVDDTELNRDSSVVVQTADATFFNMNDCKLFDSLAEIRRVHGRPDVFTCQYSGAIWHPVCYAYDPERYQAISKKKYIAKFEAVARAIESLEPGLYVPSAGPPCFLDDELEHLNREPVNIFPAAETVLKYLEKRLQKHPVPFFHALPGDTIEIARPDIRTRELGERIDPEKRLEYLETYKAAIGPILQEERHADAPAVFDALRDELLLKLDRFTFRDRIDVPLYVSLRELPEKLLRIDFAQGRIETVESRRDEPFYALTAPAWEIRRVLERQITWDEFGLTFRVSLERDPDVYQQFLYAFLILEIDTVDLYCRHMTALEQNQERIVVEYAGKSYSILRYCPHMGADLTAAYLDDQGFLTCPRHRWKYDLRDGGRCVGSDASICAEELRISAAS